MKNDAEQQWKLPPIALKLEENEVHVWQASLRTEVNSLHALQEILSEEEIIKARKFRFEKDRHHFIIARGVLRTLLGRYLKTDPRLLHFDYNAYGKPSLAYPFSESTLHFNVSHSHEVALYAFTYARQVGIDVEYMRSDIAHEELARYSFSSHERAMLDTLPKALRQQGFFNCWTRKEAYVKAKGKGLSLPLDSFDVSLRPDDPVKLLASREVPQETTRWSLQELLPASGYAAALAVAGSGWDVSCWQWK